MRSHHLHCSLHSLLSWRPGKGWLLHRREPQRHCVRATETSCEHVSNIKMASGLQEGPSRQGRVPPPNLPQHHCHCPPERQVLCSSNPFFFPPPRQGTCQDLHASKGWSPADETEPKRIRHTIWVLVKTMQANTSHISCTRDLSPHQTEGTGFPDEPTSPSSIHGQDLAFASATHSWDQQKVLHGGQC